ncbi:ABC transporter ATP-binding protein [Bacillus carboniphilus]|uniref:ABC transporter ATP-binding protein n=1 Tax=Bacillus carboniphilus TaxID=86663 RepID=A0ABY9K001_9BACI|nr:ABC transporter ATP-binding protein [Bacillus carboniphilus]WLR44147.1 ABC transporter ATP-binding protein [Bacillus carboniphilus]
MGIEINSLVKRYGKNPILNGINIFIQDPGVYLIAGPNGSGKTTLLETLVGLRKYDKGKIEINGSSKDDIKMKKKVGFLTQHNTLRKNCTVGEELQLVKELFNLNIDPYAFLEKFKLQEYYHIMTKKLSGGTKRRVLIAMLFMPSYEIVVLDEPVSGLDTFSRDEIWNMITEYASNKIVLVSDHYLNQAAQYSDFVYLLKKGKIILEGKTTDLIEHFDKGYVIKTRERNIEELNKIIEKENILFDIKISGSVYNYFFRREDYDSIRSIHLSPKYNIHPINLEDIYFYYTGEYLEEVE